MAVDFIGYGRNRMDYEDPGPSPNNPSLSMVIEEADAAVNLKTSMEHLIHILSSSSQEDSNMTKKRTLTGHARFRRGVSSSVVPQNKQSVDHTTNKVTKECDDSMSMSMSMMSSSITTNTTAGGGGGAGEGSVSNGIGIGKQQQQQGSPAPAPWSAAKPPLAATNRPRKRPSEAAIYSHHSAGHSNGHNHCHCHCKKRKHDVKRRIKIKVASTYMEIPPDEYAWKKYGQKPILGSPHRRGYYRCSSARGCPARKTVERSHHDPTILIITYGGEHRHPSNFFPLSS